MTGWGLAATVVGVTQIAERGARSAALIAAGPLVLAAFVRREMRAAEPLIRVDLLTDRLLATSLAAAPADVVREGARGG